MSGEDELDRGSVLLGGLDDLLRLNGINNRSFFSAIVDDPADTRFELIKTPSQRKLPQQPQREEYR